MIDPKTADDTTQRVMDLLLTGMRDLRHDMEKNARAALQSTFIKLDLVTREEFDVQSALLARTRAKLEALERQLAQLEKKVPAKK